jgi:hypothetical protein
MDFSDCFNLSSAALTEVSRHYRGLREINLIGCPLLVLSSIRNLAANCVHLESVSLGFTQNTDDGAVITIAEHCRHLRHLCVHMADITLSDSALVSVGQHCSRLESLVLTQKLHTFCAKFSDKGLLAVSRGCPCLSSLDVGECTEVSDAAIEGIAQNCRGMKHIRLHNCPQLTDASLRSMGAHLLLLEHFEYTKNYRFSQEALGWLRLELPSLRNLLDSTARAPLRPTVTREFWYDTKL